MKKRTVSILLAMVMVLSTASTFVFAEAELGAPADPEDKAAVLDETTGEDVTEVTEGQDAVTDEDQAAPEAQTEEDGTVEIAKSLTVTAVANNDDGSIVVTWDSTDAVKLVLYKDGAAVQELEGVTGGTYTFTGLTAGTYYASADGSNSNEVILNAPAPPEAISGFATYSASESVVLEWNKPSVMPNYYEIWSDGALLDTVTTPKSPFDNASKFMYQAKNAADEKNHSYFIKAVNKSAGTTAEAVSKKKSDQMVKQMYIKITFRTNRTLTSHDGKKVKRKFKSGYTTKAVSYAAGRYHFYDKGNLFYVNYMSIRSPRASYTKKFNYSNREAEYFVNTSRESSMKGYLIWVNLYTQHLYLFQGSTGQWKLNNTLKYKGKKYNNWEVSSGTASTPSPWGMNLKFHRKKTNIYNKKRSFPGHGANLWNFYHSLSALHGPAGRTGYGAPHSHGCIRNPQDKALFLFDKVPKKTRVIVY